MARRAPDAASLCAVRTMDAASLARRGRCPTPPPAHAKTARNSRSVRWDHPDVPACQHGDDPDAPRAAGIRRPARTTCPSPCRPWASSGTPPASARSRPWRPKPTMPRTVAVLRVSTREDPLMRPSPEQVSDMMTASAGNVMWHAAAYAFCPPPRWWIMPSVFSMKAMQR